MGQITRADGAKMRLAREEADLTVDELVLALKDIEGIERHPDTIRNAELGHSQPGIKLLHAYARVVGKPFDALLADKDKKRQTA
jgi:DNA-binding XRE family transcriptional regulator